MTRALTAAGIFLQIVLFALAISGTISCLGGWFFVARMFPDRPFAAHQVFSSTSGCFGRVVGGYRMCISVAVA